MKRSHIKTETLRLLCEPFLVLLAVPATGLNVNGDDLLGLWSCLDAITITIFPVEKKP